MLGRLLKWLRDLLTAIIDLLKGVFTQDVCPISWRPNALAPVFYAHRDYGPVDGAPGDVRVFFPSLDGSPDSGEILRDCGRYPLIVFAHGHCATDTDHFLKWFEVPAVLARAGYVVAVPRLPQISGGTSPTEADGDLALLRDLDSWLRSAWSERSQLAPVPATGLVGHSFGAGLAGRLAGEGNVRAFASLSGDVARATREAIHVPKLFVWGSNEFIPPGIALTEAEWAAVTPPKHRVVVDDLEHWDYLPAGRTSCEIARGPCGPARVASWDLLAMFLANYLPTPGVLPSQIPESLIPPLPLTLTVDQQPFAGGWLSGFPSLADEAGVCHVSLSWETPEETASTTQP
jgi:pimeloyl-ACP methyl ester carboxylesterase